MILTRQEFWNRWAFRGFDTIHKEEIEYPIEPLIKEIKADAHIRNHDYLFNGSNLSKIKCDDEIGVNKYCHENVKTEAERIAIIDQQIKTGEYTPVKIFQDWEHTDIIIIDDGFHRIYSAWKQNKKTIRCEIKQGLFILEKTMPMEDLPDLLDMLTKLFPPELHDISKLNAFLNNADKKKMQITSISYGGGRRDSDSL